MNMAAVPSARPIIFLTESFSFIKSHARTAEKTMPPLLTQGKTMLPGRFFDKYTFSVFNAPSKTPERNAARKNEGEGKARFFCVKINAATLAVIKTVIINPLCCALNSLIAKVFCDIPQRALQSSAIKI